MRRPQKAWSTSRRGTGISCGARRLEVPKAWRLGKLKAPCPEALRFCLRALGFGASKPSLYRRSRRLSPEALGAAEPPSHDKGGMGRLERAYDKAGASIVSDLPEPCPNHLK